ncbi:peptidoglycan-binding protein, partial [Pseudoalteromonas sp. S4488]
QQDFRTRAKIIDIPAPYNIFHGQSISITKSAKKSKKT